LTEWSLDKKYSSRIFCSSIHNSLSVLWNSEVFAEIESFFFSSQVVESMDALDKVVQEREDALRLLQTGQEKPRPGAWRRDIFGRIIWYRDYTVTLLR
jgi:hypothetical protein